MPFPMKGINYKYKAYTKIPIVKIQYLNNVAITMAVMRYVFSTLIVIYISMIAYVT